MQHPLDALSKNPKFMFYCRQKMKFNVLFFLLKKKTLLKFNDKNKMLRLVKNWSRVFSVQKGKAKSNVLTLLFC